MSEREASERAPAPGRLDGVWLTLLALVARLGVVVWASGRFPASADGSYYHTLAQRLAEGAGYTWAWPDGVVTYAAHYPVGYPALLSGVYRFLGPSLTAAAGMNAVLGALGVFCAHAVARRSMGRRGAVAGGLLCALDPALVLYTPALMTEGVTASLLCLAALLFVLASEAGEAGAQMRARCAVVAGGVALGVATLVRPQCVLIAPLLGLASGWWSLPSDARAAKQLGARLVSAVIATMMALMTCLPWTLRNCARMGRCALVSVNGGWNLLIGMSPTSTGHWAPVDVPPGCREVFDEAGKDVCFGDAAKQMILDEPGRFLRLMPAKLSATFDYCGAAPWYLHEAAPQVFSYEHKVATGAFETVVHRLLLLAALVAAGRGAGPRPRLRKGVALAGSVFVVLKEGYVGYLALVAVFLLQGRELLRRPLLPWITIAVVSTTALVHAVFFGAGRYSLPVFPFVALCAGGLLTGLPQRGDTWRHAPDRD